MSVMHKLDSVSVVQLKALLATAGVVALLFVCFSRIAWADCSAESCDDQGTRNVFCSAGPSATPCTGSDEARCTSDEYVEKSKNFFVCGDKSGRCDCVAGGGQLVLCRKEAPCVWEENESTEAFECLPDDENMDPHYEASATDEGCDEML